MAFRVDDRAPERIHSRCGSERAPARTGSHRNDGLRAGVPGTVLPGWPRFGWLVPVSAEAGRASTGPAGSGAVDAVAGNRRRRPDATTGRSGFGPGGRIGAVAMPLRGEPREGEAQAELPRGFSRRGRDVAGASAAEDRRRRVAKLRSKPRKPNGVSTCTRSGEGRTVTVSPMRETNPAAAARKGRHRDPQGPRSPTGPRPERGAAAPQGVDTRRPSGRLGFGRSRRPQGRRMGTPRG